MKRLFAYLFFGILAFGACRNGHEGDTNTRDSDTTRLVLNVLNQQIEDDATNPDLFHKRARYYVTSRDFDLALKDIRQAISIAPKKSVYYNTLSDIYLVTGKPDNCKEALIKSIELDPKDAEARLKLAKLYLIIKEYPNCFTTVKELLVLDPGNASAYYTRAIALLEQGDTIHAVSDLQKAVENDQANYEAYLQLGELFAMKKDPLAEMYFKNALNLKPQSREALYMLGLYYQETGMYDQAIKVYENLSKSDTTFREAPYNIGYIYMVYLNDFKKAIPFFTESIRKDPAYYKAYYNRGYAYELSGDYQNARNDYQKTLKLEVNYDKAIEGMNRLDKKSRK
jgi:tetratricopeptide (TPR) repeat protein